MLRNRASRAGLAIILVALLSLSGLVAQQGWSESQARGQVSTAHQSAQAALAHARALGLYPSELAPFRENLRSIEAEAAPSATPLWRSQVTAFYQSQSRAYAHVVVELKRAEVRITRAARAQTVAALAQLNQETGTGSGLGLDTSTAQAAWKTQSAALSHADNARPTAAAYRSIASAVHTSAGSLSRQVKARQAYLGSIEGSAGNTVAGVQALGDREIASASSDLDLLGLLTPRATQYRTRMAQLRASLLAQTDLTRAAVEEAAIHDQVAAVQADYQKTLPEKLIVVSTEAQSLNAYERGENVLTTPVTTGGPELPTDHGVFHIYLKASPFVFHSPWPPSSPFYYPPTPIQYWMPFDGAEGLHDASWRSNFGPGSNLEPTDLGTGRTILGTHGCVNLPFSAATFIWNWAPVGTTVVVV